MSIRFKYNSGATYFTVTYSGVIDDSEIYTAWKHFLESDAWIPGSNALNDLREADLTGLTSDGIMEIVFRCKSVFKNRGVYPKKIAICADEDLQYGLGRVFEVLGDATAESIKVFRGIEAAQTWLAEEC